MAKEPYRKKRRLYKRLMILLAIIIVLITGSFMFLAKNMKPVLTQKLKDQVIKSSDSLYRITFDELSVNLYTGTIDISNFRLIPDTAVYSRLKTQGIAPENLFDVSLTLLELRQAHPFRLFFQKTVQIKEVRINQPVVNIFHEDLMPNDTTQSLEVIMRKLISGPLKSIYIERVGLDNISVSYKNNSNPKAKGFNLNNVDIVFKDLAIDNTSIHDTSRYFYSKDLWVHLTDFTIPEQNSTYTFYFKDLAYSMEQETALVKGFSVKSGLSDLAFDQASGIQKDKIDFEADSIQLTGLNIINIMYRRKIGGIKTVYLADGKLDVYRNRALPEKKTIKLLPQQMLRQAAESYLMKTISTRFTLDTVSIRDLDVTYREHNPKSRRTGEVSFDKLTGTLYNVTNDSLQRIKNNHCLADLHTLFMGKSNLSVHFDFNLSDPTNPFSYSGHLSPMKAQALNNATRNLGMVSIRSGNLEKLNLHFNANNDGATGTVGLLYKDLNIKLLSLDSLSGLLKNNGVATLLTNVLVLKNTNMEGPDAVQKATINYPRNEYKSMFNLMWKSVFQGVKEILGMDKESNDRLKNSLQENKLIEKIKRNRKKNR